MIHVLIIKANLSLSVPPPTRPSPSPLSPPPGGAPLSGTAPGPPPAEVHPREEPPQRRRRGVVAAGAAAAAAAAASGPRAAQAGLAGDEGLDPGELRMREGAYLDGLQAGGKGGGSICGYDDVVRRECVWTAGAIAGQIAGQKAAAGPIWRKV